MDSEAPFSANLVAKVRRLCRSRHSRHSLAVNALLRWYQAGADVEAKLPLLATYLGHGSVVSTHHYLHFINVRLSAIHAFFHFVASRNPEHLELAQRVLGIPFKRARQRAIDYLEYDEIDAILKTINRRY